MKNLFSVDCLNGLGESTTKALVPFIACGDLTGFDSDRTYPLELNALSEEFRDWKYEHREVVQPPTEPAYKKASALKKISELNDTHKAGSIQSAGRKQNPAITNPNNPLPDNEEIDPSILFC